jgi:pimeloyl-ACP methyl ester carboxylesterase
MGGLVTQAFYHKYPDRVIALGLWNTGAKIPLGYGFGTSFYVMRIVFFVLGLLLAYPIPPLFRFVLAQGWKLGFKDKGKSDAYRRYVPSVKQLKPTAVLKAAFALAGFEAVKKLPDIKVPVMLLHGKADKNITPIQLFEKLKANIPDTMAFVSENGAHFPPNESSEEVLGYLKEFLEYVKKKE